MRTSGVVLGLLLVVPASVEPSPPCVATEIEYVTSANLKLSDTTMGVADGTYLIGPGRVVLRFEGNHVRMVAYSMRESVSVRVRAAAFWWADVSTDANTSVSTDGCGNAAKGTLDGHTLRWKTPVLGHRTDGTLTCKGPLCGVFGAPKRGTTELHFGPTNKAFGPFVFAPDMNTFAMAATPPVKMMQPKQTSQFAISGREVKRRCVERSFCR
jgi:hypothetical protein